MKINKLPVIMHLDYKNNKVSIEITEDFTYTNTLEMQWAFKSGWRSDGHSVGKYFKHFDAYTMAALCHDRDCEMSNNIGSYNMRRTGDKNYKFNLQDLGASKATILRRYAAVSTYARWLKLTGKLK